MTLTADQRRAVEAPASVAVVAGAGTGKTHMLAERYLHHLSFEGLSPLEVVAVTFTEKAAGELRSRIRQRIEESLPAGEDALAELEAAQISTIHSLCARVCREHPKEAGVSPDFGILEEAGGRAWALERLEEAIEELPEEHFHHLSYESIKNVLDRLLSDPISARRSLARGSEGWEGLVEEAKEEARKRFLESPVLADCHQTLKAYQGEVGDKMEEARANALYALETLSTVQETGPYLEALCGLDLRVGSKKKWGEGELEIVREALKGVRELAREEQKRGLITLELGPADQRLQEILPVLGEDFEKVRAHISGAKRREGVLDFADLEVHALQALQSEEVASHYAQRWKAFLIDEFQDTNPVQAEIVSRLTQGATLTVVGDEQQSIYGFRRAEVEVFRRFRKDIKEGGGSEVVLAESFRAHRELTETTNTIFPAALGEIHQPLTAYRTQAPHEGPHVRAYAIETEEKVGKDKLQRAEAALIARLIGEMLEEGMPVHDPETGSTRPATPGDFALLSRTWAPLEAYGEALAAAGIPAAHAGGGDLLQTREATDGHYLLRFLADPGDDLALLAVLRSPFFTIDDPTLHQLALEKEQGMPWWKALREYGEGERLSYARQTLGELLQARRREPPAELLKVADRLTGYSAVISNLPGADRRKADWGGFCELLEDIGGSSGDAFSAVRSLKRLQDSGTSVPRPPIEAGDAVSLTTVHGAKGLEWPVVFLPDLARRFPNSSSPVFFDPELGIGLDLGDGEESALYRVLADKEKRDREAEARRLFYVAPTRGRDLVVLASTEWEAKGLCGLTLLGPGLQKAGIECEGVPFDPEDALPPELPSPLPQEPPYLLLGSV